MAQLVLEDPVLQELYISCATRLDTRPKISVSGAYALWLCVTVRPLQEHRADVLQAPVGAANAARGWVSIPRKI